MSAVAAVTVRRAVAEDLEAIKVLEEACFPDPWDESSIMAALSLRHMRTWVAETGDVGDRQVVGYVIALLLGSEAEVADLAVSPGSRRAGVGGVLLDRLLSEARGSGALTIYLEVRESNLAAKALYLSRGFMEVGRRRSYYRHPVEDALVLRRDFEPT